MSRFICPGCGAQHSDGCAYVTHYRYPSRARGKGWTSLTPSELDIVGLVTYGMTNPQIAASLYVSRLTVKTHVESVLSKLGLDSRVDIAREYTRRKILLEVMRASHDQSQSASRRHRGSRNSNLPRRLYVRPRPRGHAGTGQRQ